MIIKASDHRDLAMTGVPFQLTSFIVITWGFLIPAPISIQILIALAVIFVMMTGSHLQNAITFSRKEAKADAWIDTLAFRLAINKAISSAQRGEYSLIDWGKSLRSSR